MTFVETERQALITAATAVAQNAEHSDRVRDAATDVLLYEAGDLVVLASLVGKLLLTAEAEAGDAEMAVRDATLWQRRIDGTVKDLEAALVSFIEEAGAPAIDTGSHTLSTSVGRAPVVITDASRLPERFLRHKPPEPDKTALATALKGGTTIEGACLGNPRPSLRRTLKERHA